MISKFLVESREVFYFKIIFSAATGVDREELVIEERFPIFQSKSDVEIVRESNLCLNQDIGERFQRERKVFKPF